MEKSEDISQHGDKAYDILCYGINMTTKILDTAMSVHEPSILDDQLKWANDRLPIDGVKPEHIYDRIRIYISVINELLPTVYAVQITNFLEWMLIRQKELMENRSCL